MVGCGKPSIPLSVARYNVARLTPTASRTRFKGTRSSSWAAFIIPTPTEETGNCRVRNTSALHDCAYLATAADVLSASTQPRILQVPEPRQERFEATRLSAFVLPDARQLSAIFEPISTPTLSPACGPLSPIVSPCFPTFAPSPMCRLSDCEREQDPIFRIDSKTALVGRPVRARQRTFSYCRAHRRQGPSCRRLRAIRRARNSVHLDTKRQPAIGSARWPMLRYWRRSRRRTKITLTGTQSSALD